MIISFPEKVAEGISMPHDDALVVTMTVANHTIHRLLVDNGSSTDILYWLVVQQMGISQDRIKPFGLPMVGFTGEQVQTMGLISLPVTCGTSLRQSTVMVDFLVVDRPSAYNIIIGWPTLNKLKAVTSTYHLMMKFPTKQGLGELRGNQIIAQRCYNTSLKKVTGSKFLPVGTVSSKEEREPKGERVEKLEDVVIGDGKILKIGLQLTPKIPEGVVSFLRENMEVFAWTHEDMLGINPKDIVHRLNINSQMSPMKQK